jgi:ribonuclease D
MRLVRSTAEEMAISPELLATRRDIEQLVYFDKGDALVKGWRKEIIGEALLTARYS